MSDDGTCLAGAWNSARRHWRRLPVSSRRRRDWRLRRLSCSTWRLCASRTWPRTALRRTCTRLASCYRVTVDSLAGLKTDADGRDSLGSLVVPIGEAITLEMTPFAQLAIEKALVAARA